MSDRDDVEVVEKADNDDNGGELPRISKSGFFDMIKRAFSTDDDTTETEDPDDVENADESRTSGVFSMFKRSRSTEEQPSSEQAEQEISDQEQTDSSRDVEVKPAAQIEPPKEPDPIEEEEFLMISAFLEGEEYTAPSPDENDAEYDIQNAFEEEDTVFEVDDENEDEDSQSIQSEEEKAEQTEQTADATENDSAVEISEDKTDSTADEKSEEKADSTIDEKAAENGDRSEIPTEPLDNADADDEEFIAEEELLFDESDDETEIISGDDDFDELSTIFGEDEDNSSDDPAKAAEGEPQAGMSEPLEDNDGEEKPEAEANAPSEEKPEAEADAPAEEKPEAEADTPAEEKPEAEADTPAEEKPEAEADTPAEEKPEAEADTPAEEKPEAKSDTPAVENSEESMDFEDISSTSAPEENKGKVKVFFGKVKKKLSEMWNAKDIPENESVAQPENDEDENDGWIYNNSAKDEAESEGNSNSSVDKQSSDHNYNKNSEAAEQPKKPELVVISENDDDSTAHEDDIHEDSSEDQDNENAKENSDNEETKAADNEAAEQPPEPILTKTGVQIEVIKNDNVSESNVDEEQVRGSLNVIEQKASDVLTDEQKREIEDSRRTLERAEEFERDSEREREQLRREQTAPSEIEITDYHAEGSNSIKFAAGRFSESVKTEYECIVNYKKMISVSSKEALTEHNDKTEESTASSGEKKPRRIVMPEIGQSEIPELQEAREFERNHDKIDSIGKRLDYRDERSPEPVEYRSEEDEESVRDHLNSRRKSDFTVCAVTAGVTAAAFLVSCFAGAFTVGKGTESLASSQRIFALIQLILYAASLFVNRNVMINGLKPLRSFKANADTGAAMAAAAAAVQMLMAVITPRSFLSKGLNFYVLPVMLALSVMAVGRYMDSDRAAANFRFVSDPAQKFAGKFFPDPRKVATLLSGTRSDKTELSYQKKAAFLTHFIRISRAEDPGSKLASRFSLPALIAAVLVALIGGIASKSFFDGWSILCVMLFAGIPIGSRALVSIPMHKLSKNSLLNKSMIASYFAVETFSDSAAVMIDAKDLYPEGSIQMEDFKALDPYSWQDGLYAAAAVTMAAGGAMTGVFDGMIKKSNRVNIPVAENVIIEDGKGLIGTVKNERIFVGNGSLLRSNGIPAPDESEEEQYRENGNEPVYIAMGRRLVGVILVRYTANHRVADVLKHMETADMSLLVRTTDANITAERIARDFRVNVKCVKVLETKNSNFIRNEMVGKEKSAPAFIATRGGVMSFGLAVSECIRMKRNVSLSLAVEIVGALLRAFIVAIIILFGGVQYLSAVTLFILSLIWIAAVLGAPMIAKRFMA